MNLVSPDPFIPPKQDWSASAGLFKALSDPARLQILERLSNQNLVGCSDPVDGVCACDFEQLTGLSQPTVSHHMRILQESGLVVGERKGKWTYYWINQVGVRKIRDFSSFLAE